MAEEKMPVNLRYLKNGTWNSMELQPVISLRSNDDWKEVMGDKDLYNLLAYYLKSGIENQVKKILPSSKLYFMDEEGDKVLLGNFDSYVEAMKAGQKTGTIEILAEEQMQDVAVPTLTSSPPIWFWKEMQKMKSELKQEILSEIKTIQPAAPAPAATIGILQTNAPVPEPPKGDYIARALKHGESSTNGLEMSKSDQAMGGAKPKKFKGDYISRVITDGWTTVEGLVREPALACGECGEEVGEPYYTCLNQECMVLICRKCETRHPVGHAMLRLPKQMTGGRRFAASTARMLLLSMKSSKQPHKKSEKKKEEKALKKEEKALKKEEKVLKKAAKEAGRPKASSYKRQAECVWMESVVSGGTAMVTWMIVNIGKKPWDNDVKLVCLACSDPELKPVECEVTVPPLKPGEDACISVRLTTPKPAGEYKTYWILSRRGKRIADLSASIANVEVMSIEQEQPLVQDTSPMSETYERIEYQESTEIVDEDGSLISGITVCKSAAVEQEYDLIPGNCDSADIESIEELNDRDSSYVSIASPVVVDESPDTTSDLTEIWQRLSISLSSLPAPMSDSDTCRLADVEVEIKEGDHESTVTRMDESLATACGFDDSECEDGAVVIAVGIAPPAMEVEEGEKQAVADVAEKPEEQQGQEEAIGAAQDHTYSSSHSSDDGLKSISSSRSNSFDNKRHQFSETVTNALSNAFMTTTQTLATVGATAKEIHTMASHIVRTNFHAHNVGKESWQPPRAWVPKATQTTWTPAENREGEDKGPNDEDVGYDPCTLNAVRLVEMGFCDVEKNKRLLRENFGNMERVILILLDEKTRGSDAL